MSFLAWGRNAAPDLLGRILRKRDEGNFRRGAEALFNLVQHQMYHRRCFSGASGGENDVGVLGAEDGELLLAIEACNRRARVTAAALHIPLVVAISEFKRVVRFQNSKKFAVVCQVRYRVSNRRNERHVRVQPVGQCGTAESRQADSLTLASVGLS